MTEIKVVEGELRAYLRYKGRWCHVYILSSSPQLSLTGEETKMISYKLTKNSRDILMAEKSKFYQYKPIHSNKKY
jgi:hypothetical protein